MTLEEKKREIAFLMKLRGIKLLETGSFKIEERCRYDHKCKLEQLTFLTPPNSLRYGSACVVAACPEHLHFYLEAKWEEV